MTNYLFLFRGGQPTGLSPQQLQENTAKWAAWMGDMAKRGIVKGGEPLATGGRQVVGKKLAIVDGPFGETKDIVGGYLVVSAADLNAATELARGCPHLRVRRYRRVRAAAWPSRRNRARARGFLATSGSISLTAVSCPRVGSSTRRTTPMPPRPRILRTR